MEKLLTIAIPTYNRPEKTRRALEAIAAQYDERVEILICDDSTTNDTAKVVHDLQKKIPINYIKNEINLGYDKNFIQCFRKAFGKYVLLMGDDDLIVNGGLTHILNVLSANDNMTWIFINFGSFRGEYVDENSFYKYHGAIIPDNMSASKDEFLDYAQSKITSLCCILNREKVVAINDLDKFIGTYFVQTCLGFEVTKDKDSKLGIIGKPCIANDSSQNAANISNQMDKYFDLFGLNCKSIICSFGVDSGYNLKKLKNCYGTVIKEWSGVFVALKVNKDNSWIKSFWELGYPAIRDYLYAWLFIIPIVIMPRWFSCLVQKIIRPIFRKLNRLNQ